MLSVRQSRRQRGASMVELGLVLFILLLLVAGIADFGRVFNHYVVITNASREGARYASRFSDDKAEIEAAVEQEVEGSSIDPEELVIEIDPDPGVGGAAAPGEPIVVTVRYEIPTILADIAGFGSLPFQARTEMVVFYDGQ